MKKSAILLLICLISFRCKDDRVPLKEQWKNEIVETENSFSKMAQTKGIAQAFLHYADTAAVLMRNNKLIIGKDNIEKDFQSKAENLKNLTLQWAPDFVEVSSSGDLGYTYGEYEISSKDSLGNLQTDSGIFHTVWKRQNDGSWKFVFD